MTTLTSPIVARVLDELYLRAEREDRPMRERNAHLSPEERKRLFEAQQADYRATYQAMQSAYIPIDREFGTLVYLLARARRATTIVEFGTSFALSTIHLAAALKDNGGGRLITTEFIASKAEAARRNLEAAGVADVVEIRLGDALETLRQGVGQPIDLVLLDGAKNLYVPVLRLLEPTLAANALIVTDNTSEDSAYVRHVRAAGSGYVSAGLGFPAGNEVSLWVGR